MDHQVRATFVLKTFFQDAEIYTIGANSFADGVHLSGWFCAAHKVKKTRRNLFTLLDAVGNQVNLCACLGYVAFQKCGPIYRGVNSKGKRTFLNGPTTAD